MALPPIHTGSTISLRELSVPGRQAPVAGRSPHLESPPQEETLLAGPVTGAGSERRIRQLHQQAAGSGGVTSHAAHGIATPSSLPVARWQAPPRQEFLPVLLRARRSLRQVQRRMGEMHALLAETIGREESVSMRALGERDIMSVRTLEQYLNSAAATVRAIDDAVHALDCPRPMPASASGTTAAPGMTGAARALRALEQAGRSTVESTQKRAAGALLLAVVSMGVKNLAWQIGGYLQQRLPEQFAMRGMTPTDHLKILERVAMRWAVANGIAALGEYPSTVYAQRLWRSLGSSMNTYNGAAMAFDMVAAIATLKTSGEEVHWSEVLSLSMQALAVSIYLGLGAAAWKMVAGGREGGHVSQIPLAVRQEDQSGTGTGLPSGARARREATGLERLAHAFPESAWRGDVAALQRQAQRITALRDRIALSAVTGITAGEDPEAVEPSDETIRELIERVRTHAGLLESMLGSTRGPGTAADIEALLATLRAQMEQLRLSAGRDPKAMAFLAAMGGVWSATLVASAATSRTGNLNGRATALAAGSVAAQTVAQLLHLAIPDQPARSALRKLLRSILISVGATLFEFSPQQAGFALSDLSRELAGTTPQAPDRVWPNKAQMRTLMETLRVVFMTLFTHFVLGERTSGSHYAGMALSAVAAGFALGMGRTLPAAHAAGRGAGNARAAT